MTIFLILTCILSLLLFARFGGINFTEHGGIVKIRILLIGISFGTATVAPIVSLLASRDEASHLGSYSLPLVLIASGLAPMGAAALTIKSRFKYLIAAGIISGMFLVIAK